MRYDAASGRGLVRRLLTRLARPAKTKVLRNARSDLRRCAVLVRGRAPLHALDRGAIYETIPDPESRCLSKVLLTLNLQRLGWDAASIKCGHGMRDLETFSDGEQKLGSVPRRSFRVPARMWRYPLEGSREASHPTPDF